MPGRKRLRGVGEKEQRMYEHIKKSGKSRYGARSEEVAARTVMKHHKEEGHETGEQNYLTLKSLKKLSTNLFSERCGVWSC